MNIYIFDFLFLVAYLYIKFNIFRLLSCKLRWYLEVKEVIFKFEYGLILAYLYIRPAHTQTEAAVSFWLSLTSVLLFDLIILSKFKKHKNCPK